MTATIKMTISGKGETLAGFRYFWLKTVTGYDLSQHCARCLIGAYHRDVSKDMRLNQTLDLGVGVKYLCGVSPRYPLNLHVAVEYAAGEIVEVDTYRGDVVRFDNARKLLIPPLARGSLGLSSAYTDCRNFQFAVHRNDSITDSTSA